MAVSVQPGNNKMTLDPNNTDFNHIYMSAMLPSMYSINFGSFDQFEVALLPLNFHELKGLLIAYKKQQMYYICSLIQKRIKNNIKIWKIVSTILEI